MSARTWIRIGSFVLVAALVPASSLAIATFTPLGDLIPGPGFQSWAWDVSGDGSTAVGQATSPVGLQAFRTVSGAMVGLGHMASGTEENAFGTSHDGSVLVGQVRTATGFEAWRWTAAAGFTSLGDFAGGAINSIAHDVSADGSIIVGYGTTATGREAMRWTAATGMVGLGYLHPGGNGGNAWALTPDGSVIVGTSDGAGGVSEAFVWTAATGMVGLGDFAGGPVQSSARGVSADGSVIVGSGFSTTTRAFRWTAGTGMVDIGDLPGGNAVSVAEAVSGDGSIIVGLSGATGGNRAFIWDEDHGMRLLSSVLTELGVNLAGWTLIDASAISDDGRTIVGFGTNPEGWTEAFIATIPEPSTLVLLALGLAGLARRRG